MSGVKTLLSPSGGLLPQRQSDQTCKANGSAPHGQLLPEAGDSAAEIHSGKLHCRDSWCDCIIDLIAHRAPLQGVQAPGAPFAGRPRGRSEQELQQWHAARYGSAGQACVEGCSRMHGTPLCMPASQSCLPCHPHRAQQRDTALQNDACPGGANTRQCACSCTVCSRSLRDAFLSISTWS